MMQTFWPGETVRATFAFVDAVAGTPLSVSGVAISYSYPESSTTAAGTGTVAGGSITNPSTGVYVTDLVLTDAPGIWTMRATASGPSAAAVEVQFRVRPSGVLPN